MVAVTYDLLVVFLEAHAALGAVAVRRGVKYDGTYGESHAPNSLSIMPTCA